MVSRKDPSAKGKRTSAGTTRKTPRAPKRKAPALASTRSENVASTTSTATVTPPGSERADTPDTRLATAVLVIAALALLIEGYALVNLLSVTVDVPDMGAVADSFESAARTSASLTATMDEVAAKLDDVESTARGLPGLGPLADDVAQVGRRMRRMGESTRELEAAFASAGNSLAGSDLSSLVSLHTFLVVQTAGLILLLVALLLDAALRLGMVGGA